MSNDMQIYKYVLGDIMNKKDKKRRKKNLTQTKSFLTVYPSSILVFQIYAVAVFLSLWVKKEFEACFTLFVGLPGIFCKA